METKRNDREREREREHCRVWLFVPVLTRVMLVIAIAAKLWGICVALAVLEKRFSSERNMWELVNTTPTLVAS
jgi:hypothetical protein